MAVLRKPRNLIGILLLIVAGLFWLLETTRIIPLLFFMEGVYFLFFTVLLPGIVGFILVASDLARILLGPAEAQEE